MVSKAPVTVRFGTLAELNKKIIEIKKKIQLSEGQRKALFEDCEAERKSNADEILKLKKEITTLVVTLHESKSSSAKQRVKNKRLEEVIGPLSEKTCAQVKELLDLQIIDKSKKLNLLKYRTKKRRKYLAELGEQYQRLARKTEKKELAQKVEKPVKKNTSDLQNNIHAVEIQMREANHIRKRYLDIRKSLKDDSGKFEANIRKLEEEVQNQNSDIEKLQKIMDEATKRRGKARGHLLKEERSATSTAIKRDQEAAEGRRLVNERKSELERLEKRLFQGGRLPARPEPEGAEVDAPEEEKSPTPTHPVELLSQKFEQLKQATGGTTTAEVLEKFQAQKDTQQRLNTLRKKSEDEKHQLEKNLETLKNKLESYKYAEVKDAERKTGEMEKIQREIDEYNNKLKHLKEKKLSKDGAIKKLLSDLHGLYLSINPVSLPKNNPLELLDCIRSDLKTVLEKLQLIEAQNKQEDENKQYTEILIENPEDRMPAPYAGLLRRTPLPPTGGSPAPPPPPGSEDEEEVPSRGYLKRQAQLVVDAKSRRKNIRMQLPKRN